jgi:glycosyltransferase involved in cell wall biosynthesis
MGMNEASPLFPDVGVVSLVSDHWSDYWQPRHQILTRLGRYFHVVWVNPAQELGDVLALKPSLSCPQPNQYPGFTVYSPEVWLPKLYRPQSLSDFVFRQRLRHACDLLEKQGVQKKILYIWRPDFGRAVDLVSFEISCYHIDDEYSFSTLESPIEEAEKQLLSRVSQVFVHSPGLMEKKGKFNPCTEMIPNGVDFSTYARCWDEPSDLAAVPKPRIGYTGYLKKHLDWPLLQSLSERHPEWSFVLVGPVSPHAEVGEAVEALRRRPNVYFLGAKAARDLPSYTQHFDVCTMPYLANDYTKYIYPLKLHEYLASGRPTVATRIRSLEDFSQVISLVCTPDEWSAQLNLALQPQFNTLEWQETRRAVASRHDWKFLVAQIARTLLERLGIEPPVTMDKLL